MQPIDQLNSFRLKASTKRLAPIETRAQLDALLPLVTPFIVLGGGSNMLFSQDFDGTIIHNRLRGVRLTQDDAYYYLQVAGGESWHDIVMYCASKGIGGLENLALIPGTVGAAPVQNIGAYGVEFCDVCQHVEAVDLITGVKHVFSAQQCEFAYRESQFKTKRELFITSVTLKLAKAWQPVLNYGELKSWSESLAVLPQCIDITNKVIEIRSGKLPNPDEIPNVGSFFKNPVVSKEKAISLSERFPAMPQYHTGEQVKLAAGWLIDQLGLKGFSIGGAAVHQRQALVLINQDNASATDVLSLAHYVRHHVSEHYGVLLALEVNVIGKDGYSDIDKELMRV